MEKNKSGFDIMNLLAQSVAKINAMEELEGKRTELENKMLKTAKCRDVVSIVYHYLRGESPSIASLLLDIHPDVDMDCTITLEEVVQEWKLTGDKGAVSSLSKYKHDTKETVKKNKDFIKRKGCECDNAKALHLVEKMKKTSVVPDNAIKDVSVTVSKNKSKRKSEVKDVRKPHQKVFQKETQFFTPREDAIILNTIKEMGDDINLKELANELGRDPRSVKHRLKKLKSGNTGRIRHKHFSLTEDEAILEKVLPGLQKCKLRNLVLHDEKFLDDLAAALGRPNNSKSVGQRWNYYLQPWIMQHYAGTLNLDIRMMLVNHLAETYQNRKSVDWEAVAEKSEFAGNTATNLKQTFALVLSATYYAKTSQNKVEASWEQILDRCREYISQTRRKNCKKTELRRFQVIQYFENYVNKLKIDDFL